MKRSLSGIKPTGTMHIGNYFGAVKQYVDNQDNFEGLYFIADYHSLNSHPEAETLQENTMSILLDYLALGLDPAKSTIFLQSAVPEVTELTWILSNIVSMPYLQRAHAYKDKSAKGETVNMGLFLYPVLMAVDILIYDSDIVPIGKDQTQHLEMAREIAQKFNSRYGECFKIPEGLTIASSAVVPGTDGNKMSKSNENTIEMFAGKKTLKKQVMSIQTDSTPLEEPKKTEGCNVIALYKLFASSEELSQLEGKYRAGNYGYGHAKLELLDKLLEYFEGARAKRDELAKNMDYVESVLKDGSRKARELAAAKTDKVKNAVGLLGNRFL